MNTASDSEIRTRTYRHKDFGRIPRLVRRGRETFVFSRFEEVRCRASQGIAGREATPYATTERLAEVSVRYAPVYVGS